MSLYDRILGFPFVYDHVRPFVVGGIDMGPVYDRLGVKPGDTVLDVGCGTGVALEHLPAFARYIGIDTDSIAIGHAKKRTPIWKKGEVSFECRLMTTDDVETLSPDVVVLAGLLHHIDDPGCLELLRSLSRSPRLRRVVTQDITILPHRKLNNILSVLDRGQYCRPPSGYETLAERAGFTIEESVILPAKAGNDRVSYAVMSLQPRRPGSASVGVS